MSFDNVQTRHLQAKLKRRYVKTRIFNGEQLSYLEGWHVISEANRIFGFLKWDRQTLSPHCHWTHQQAGWTSCFYSTKVRISVSAGGAVIVREGLGTGMGRSQQPENAHEMAIKSAETDATKRALATFGNAFGLALYDPGQSQVTKLHSPLRSSRRKLSLKQADGAETYHSDVKSFADAMLKMVDEATSIERLYVFWALNIGSIRAFDEQANGAGLAARIIDSIKFRARQLAIVPLPADSSEPAASAHGEIAESFLLPKEKRIRDREHLAFVATQPCFICGRQPAQAHHLRFAQHTAMSMKVSDEFTVPLCTIHHDQLHRSGDEKAFWTNHNIFDPLQHAAKLWAMSHPQAASTRGEWHPDAEKEFNEPSLGRK